MSDKAAGQPSCGTSGGTIRTHRVRVFTGAATQYAPSDKALYRTAGIVAITTYSSLFNANPFFFDAEIVLLDDAHASENYIASVWSLQVDRENKEQAGLHAALANLFKPLLDPVNYGRLLGECDGIADRTWVDKIPGPKLANIAHELTATIDAHIGDLSLKWPWRLLRGHLERCQSPSTQEILIRPLIPPTWTHAAFNDPKQRIFMSATLGAGGDLERLTGRRSITRLPVPAGWDRQGIGRRYFIFPQMSLRQEETVALRRDLMRRAGRSLVLVPSDAMKREIAADVSVNLEFPTFDATAIEASKAPFVRPRTLSQS